MKFKYNGEYKFDANINLKPTIESGQTFLWNKDNGIMFKNDSENPIYSTARLTEQNEVLVLRVYSDNNILYWESTHSEGREYIKSIFQLDKNMTDIQNELIKKDTSGVIKKAIDIYPSLRIVHEPLFPTLISFICSTQMRVERIHDMVQKLSKRYGKSVTVNGSIYSAFPTPDELNDATEEELKELKLGYRANYVIKTVRMINSNEVPLEIYTDANESRKQLEKYIGVGPKVADCVLLYGGGFSSIVPVDVWIQRAAEKYYPNIVKNNKSDTARALENLFGEYAGFAQAYIFHYMRTNEEL